MIKPEELRIGNWVKWPNEKEPNEVEWSHGHWLGVHQKNYTFPEPIPLTEEWLVKMGFVIDSDYDYRNYILPRNNFIVSVWMRDDQPGGFEIPRGAYWGDMFKHIPFVHSLQNLYFVIVGEELKLA